MIDARRCKVRTRGALGAASVALLLVFQSGAAQDPPRIPVRGEVFVGSEIEHYLRDLQVAGLALPYPWTVRGLSPAEVEHVSVDTGAHAWAGRYALEADTSSGLRLRAVRARSRLFYNSAFPAGTADGAVWAGRGLTASLEGGVTGEWGPLSFTLAPVAFVAQNAAFALLDPGVEDQPPYADPFFPSWIDRPQRFGDGRYAVVDPGQSTLRLDSRGFAAGISTANLQWGPASDHPLLLGNDAPGFTHVFFGSARPANVWIGRLHARVVWGDLRESPVIHESIGRRMLAGTIATFSPRGLPGLEIGGGRVFHVAWPRAGEWPDAMLKPLDSFLKAAFAQGPDDDGSREENQLATAFFRWVHAPVGVEIWGEYAREDHSFDIRDFLLEPDHSAAVLLGGRKVWVGAGGAMTSLRAEFVNARITHLSKVRSQAPFYVHSAMRQGHTHRGQLLGSAAAYGGLGSVVAMNHYRPDGRWSVAWTRMLQDATGAQARFAETSDGTWASNSLAIERLLFVRRLELAGGVVADYQMNRHFAGDAFNLTLALTASHPF